MNALNNGTPVSAKVVELTKDYMSVSHCGRIYRIDFDRYPYFRSCFLSELYNVQASADGLHWPDADIDLELEYIEPLYKKTTAVTGVSGEDMINRFASPENVRRGGTK